MGEHKISMPADLFFKDTNGNFVKFGVAREIEITSIYCESNNFNIKGEFKTLIKEQSEPNIKMLPEVDHITYDNDMVTVIHFKDGTTEMVKTDGKDSFDKEVGFAMAYLRKCFGSRNQYQKLIKNATVRHTMADKEMRKARKEFVKEYMVAMIKDMDDKYLEFKNIELVVNKYRNLYPTMNLNITKKDRDWFYSLPKTEAIEEDAELKNIVESTK